MALHCFDCTVTTYSQYPLKLKHLILLNFVCCQAMSCDARLETPPTLPHGDGDSDSSSISYSSDDELCDEADHLSLPSTSSLLHSALTRMTSGNEYGTSHEGHTGKDYSTSVPIQDRSERSDATTAATSIEQPRSDVSPTMGKDAVEASTCGDDVMSFTDDNDESSKAALLSSEDSNDDDDDDGDDDDGDDDGDDDASDRLGDDRLPSDEEEIELDSDDDEEESDEDDEEEEKEEEREMEEEVEGKEKTESEGKDDDSEKQDKGKSLCMSTFKEF